jgi:hypothetical protein
MAVFVDWQKHMSSLIELAGKRGWDDLYDILTFEQMYVTYYQRGLASPVLERRQGEPPAAGDPAFRDYLDHTLLPLIEWSAAREKALAENVTFEITATEFPRNSRWTALEPGEPPKVSADPWMRMGEVTQHKVDAPFAMAQLGEYTFSEAIFTAQVKVHEIAKGREKEARLGEYILFDPEESDSNMGTMTVKPAPNQWIWVRVHFTYQGDGAWRFLTWARAEGGQPHDFRSLRDEDIPEDAWVLEDYSPDAGLGPLPERAAIALGTKYMSATWRALGLEIVRPAPPRRK